MFDGSFKSSRKVNLSGRKPTTAGGTGSANASLSKDELLLQSKRLREERLAHKQRSAASTTIQALCRRVATARRVRSRALTELETDLAALVGPGGAPPSAPVATATLQQLVRKFLIANGRKDRVLLTQDVATQRLANAQNYVLVVLLMSAVQGGERGVLAMPKDATWVYQIVRVLEIALRIVVGLIGDTTDQVKAVCLVLLETFTTRERYIAAGAQDADTVLPRVVQQLAQSDGIGVFAALRRLVQRDEAATSEDRVQQIVVRVAVLSLQPLYFECDSSTQSSLERNPVLVQFARKIVLTPGAFSSPLMQRVMQGLSSTTTKRATQQDGVFWGATLSVLCREEDAGLSWRDAAIAVGNVLDLLALSGFPPSIVERGTALLARVITTSHIQWAFGVESSSPYTITSGQVDVDMDDDDYALATAQSQLVLEAFDHHDDGDQVEKGIQSLGASQQRIQSQWQQLYETRFVQRLFDAAQAPSAMRHLSRAYTTFLLGLGRTHLLSVRQSFKLPPLEFTAFLSAVSRELLDNVTVIKRVWDLVRSSSATRSRSEETLQPLLLFNAIYSHMLLTLDDETFYDRAWPFQLGDIADIVTYLKQFIFDVCWNANTTTNARQEDANANHNMNRHLFPALTTSVKLFNQLYDRDCRRKFTSDGAWLWPSMPVIKETVDLASMEGDLVELQALASLTSPHATLTPQARASLILTTIPQVFSFPDRVQLFEKLLNEEKQSMDHVRSEFSRALHVRVKRDEIVDDSYEFFHKVCTLQSPSALKSRIKVTFVNEQGLEEAGIDGGGVFKEYVDQLTRQAFSPEYGFFLATNEQLLYPNPGARWIVETPTDLMDRFRFLGRVLGKAVYEEILVEPQFAAFFLNKLLGKFNYIDDLHSLDPDLYRNLMQLKHYDGSVEDLALTFSVSEKAFGQVVTRDLIPDGANIPVTNESKIRYIHLLANYKLNVLSSHESAAFLRGFRDLIPAKWIQMFSPSELQMLIGGTAQTIDVADWQRHTAYGGGYHPSQRPIQWFWDLVENEFTAEDRAALLKFITSVSRQPLLGFAQLAPQICIHQVRIDDDERLPSSATCMNLLKLPTYSSKAIMKKKLLYAIRANAGFDLS